MKKLAVEVIGVSPPCARCRKAEETVRNAALNLERQGIKVEITKVNITAKDTLAKYGVLVSPAIAVNGTVKIMGKVPDVRVIERLLRQTM